MTNPGRSHGAIVWVAIAIPVAIVLLVKVVLWLGAWFAWSSP